MQAEVSGIRLVVGLGNPGAEYERTRHNIGFAVVDRLAVQLRADWQREKKWGAYWAKADDLLLVKPMTYMNRSGEPLAAVANFYKVVPGEMLVIFDDMALDLARLRLRLEGGTGGHNGMDSVITTFGTDKIPRLRVGIGAAPGFGAVDYVLGRFFQEEMPAVEKAVVRAADAAKWAIDNGVLSAMNTFNKNPEE